MLLITGYPVAVDDSVPSSVGMSDLLDAAERLERLKYGTSTHEPQLIFGTPAELRDSRHQWKWFLDGDGELVQYHTAT